jgi:hypothetical protein
MGTRQIQNRLAQFGGPADRLINGIQTRDATQNNIMSLRMPDAIEHQAAEAQGQHQVVELVPIEPIRFRRCL